MEGILCLVCPRCLTLRAIATVDFAREVWEHAVHCKHGASRQRAKAAGYLLVGVEGGEPEVTTIGRIRG